MTTTTMTEAARDADAVLVLLAQRDRAIDFTVFSAPRQCALAQVIVTPAHGITLLHYLAAIDDPPPLCLSPDVLRADRTLAAIANHQRQQAMGSVLGPERRAALIAVWLLQHGANAGARDARGATPLHMAAAAGRGLLVAVLMTFAAAAAAGGGDHGSLLAASDVHGNTALHYAADGGYGVLFTCMVDEWQANWAQRNLAGQAPAMLLIRSLLSSGRAR